MENRIVTPGKSEKVVVSESGDELSIPEGWELLPPGDGPLTKLVKAKGATWLVQVKKGRRLMSKGVWADASHILEARTEIELKRIAPGYQKKREKEKERREKTEREYHNTFITAIEDFLDFDQRYRDLSAQLAGIVAEHATPVGSGTVARTKRIPMTSRASYAVIAWMRHETTRYDTMTIPLIKGRRRQVRRELATQSTALLNEYRKGKDTPDSCPLKRALAHI